MRKIALLGVIMMVIAMMMGGQTALAKAPPAKLTAIAKGQVDSINSSVDIIVDEACGGPWNLVFHTNQGTANFNATCQTSIGVVKVSANGPASTTWDAANNRWMISGVGGAWLTFTVKCKGVQVNRTGAIYVNAGATPLVFVSMAVDFNIDPPGGPTGTMNVTGTARVGKVVP